MSILGHVPNTELDLVDAKEAAEIARVTRRTISRWAESGRLPVAKETRGEDRVALRLFRRADVHAATEPTEAAS